MNLKQALLACLESDQLKELCIELDLDADRRSRESMVAALTSAKRAKPELLIEKLTVQQLREVLGQLDESAEGRKEDLIARILASKGRGAGNATVVPAEDAASAGYLGVTSSSPRARAV